MGCKKKRKKIQKASVQLVSFLFRVSFFFFGPWPRASVVLELLSAPWIVHQTTLSGTAETNLLGNALGIEREARDGGVFGGGKDKSDSLCLVQRCYVRWVWLHLDTQGRTSQGDLPPSSPPGFSRGRDMIYYDYYGNAIVIHQLLFGARCFFLFLF